MAIFNLSVQNSNLYFKHDITYSPPCTLISNHMHSAYEILYILSGDASLVIEDKETRVRPGDLIVVPPRYYHYLKINSPVDYERYNFLFMPSELDVGDDLIPHSYVVNITNNHFATEIFKKFDYYYSVFDTKKFAEVAKLLLKELLFALSVLKQPVENGLSSVLNPVLSDALSYIKENLFTLTGIAEVANKLYVSESYLFYLFKTYVKTTPKRYLTEKRLLASKALIAQGVKPTKAFEQVGFNDYTSFYRNFVKFFGYAPSNDKDVIPNITLHDI